MGYVWLCLTVFFGILEAATVQIVSIWFAGGAVCAMIAFALGANKSVQIVVFVLSSGILLALTRPFVKKMTKGKKTPTNADSLIGKTAVVTKKPMNSVLRGKQRLQEASGQFAQTTDCRLMSRNGLW